MICEISLLRSWFPWCTRPCLGLKPNSKQSSNNWPEMVLVSVINYPHRTWVHGMYVWIFNDLYNIYIYIEIWLNTCIILVAQCFAGAVLDRFSCTLHDVVHISAWEKKRSFELSSPPRVPCYIGDRLRMRKRCMPMSGSVTWAYTCLILLIFSCVLFFCVWGGLSYFL